MTHQGRSIPLNDISARHAPAAGRFWFYFGFGHRARALP